MKHGWFRLSATILWTAALANVAGADGKAVAPLKVEQAVRANLLPLSPAYITTKCLIPYPLCKLAYASVSLIASWEQLLTGGDLDGAEHALARGFSGPWMVRPTNVSGDALWSAPPPIPLVAYFATGRSNIGSEQLEPMPAAKRPAFEGDV